MKTLKKMMKKGIDAGLQLERRIRTQGVRLPGSSIYVNSIETPRHFES